MFFLFYSANQLSFSIFQFNLVSLFSEWLWVLTLSAGCILKSINTVILVRLYIAIKYIYIYIFIYIIFPNPHCLHFSNITPSLCEFLQSRAQMTSKSLSIQKMKFLFLTFDCPIDCFVWRFNPQISLLMKIIKPIIIVKQHSYLLSIFSCFV